MDKKSSSQASWSLLAEGVSSSRVETHNLRSFFEQMKSSIDSHESEEIKEEIYSLCGDNLSSIPRTLEKIERSLDRTNYALITMGKDFYRQRLPHEDREKVDMASKYNPTPKGMIKRVATLYIEASKGSTSIKNVFPMTSENDNRKAMKIAQVILDMLSACDLQVLKMEGIEGAIFSTDSEPSYVDQSGIAEGYYALEEDGIVGAEMLIQCSIRLSDLRRNLKNAKIDSSNLMRDLNMASKRDMKEISKFLGGRCLSRMMNKPNEEITEGIQGFIYENNNRMIIDYGDIEDQDYEITGMGVVGSSLVVKSKITLTYDDVTFQAEEELDY